MTTLETNGPMIASEMREVAANIRKPAEYVVVTLAYNRANSRAFRHRTLGAAFRTLASVVDSSRGKKHRRGEFAACVVTPENSVINYTEARDILYFGA